MLETFEAQRFRCFERIVLPAGGRSIGLVGPNGSGKTSLLEGIHFLSYGRSFRVADRRQLIRSGSDGFRVAASIEDSLGRKSLSARWNATSLELEVNGRAADGVGELAAHLRAHLIDPSVHRLIEGGPQERRRILDTGAFHVEHDYLAHWRRYRRALKQRNAALRGARPAQNAAVWDESLCEAAAHIDAARAAYVSAWSLSFRATAAAFGLMDASLSYRAGRAPELDMATALRESIERDVAHGMTSVGPHRADVAVMLGGRAARRWVSRGQQKMLASALVLGQVQRVQEAGATPLLLLDDPAAELDVDNLGKFLSVIGQLNVQIIATATFPIALEALPQLHLFHVKQDGLEPML